MAPTAVFEYGLAWFKKLIDVQSVEESIVNWSCGSVSPVLMRLWYQY
jgi:hypothetical protein